MPDSSGRPLTYRVVAGGVRLVLRLFFREIAVEGREHVPDDRGGLVVSWHPNGLLDPALILTPFPRRIVFGARHGLLRWPVLGPLMRSMGTVPIYRAVDEAGMTEAERREANEASLDALAGAVADGAYAALFPEGVSHDDPHLARLKTGAARLYARARALAEARGRPTPVILPVGLHYDAKAVFRSDVLVEFHPPMALPPALDRVPGPDDAQAHARALTDAIETELVEAVHATEDWGLHRLMNRARALLRAEGDRRLGAAPSEQRIADRVEVFSQIWEGYRVRRASHPRAVERLRADLTAYDRRLRALGLADADLDQPPRVSTPLLLLLIVGQALGLAFVVVPLVVLGFVVNAGPYWLLKPAARRFSKAEKDTATVKILGGLVLFPLAWALAGAAAALAHARLHAAFPELPDTPVLTGLVVALLSAVGGALALHLTEVAQAVARSARVWFVRARHPERLEALRTDRAELHDRLLVLAEGLELAA